MEKTNQLSAGKPLSKTKKIIYGTIIAVGAVMMISNLFRSDPSSSSPAPSAPTSTVAIGETGYLRSSADPILVPISKALLDRTTQLAVAKDTMGISEMVLNGEILPVKNGTQVRVIDAGWTSVEVRIMSGDYAGQSGWVPTEFVKN